MNIVLSIPVILKTKTISHFFVTSLGTAINGALGLLFYVLLARSLGPVDFGLIIIAITTMTLLTDIGDLGVDSGIVRFLGKYSTQKEVYLKFLKTGLIVKTLMWVVIFSLGWFISPFIARQIFLKPELTLPLQLSLIGVGGAAYFSLATHALQALQKFKAWSLINISMNGLRLVMLLALITLGIVNLKESLIIYISIPFLGFFLSLFLLPNFVSPSLEKSVSKEFFHYSKWIAFLTILTATSSRLDTFLSGRLLSLQEVGIYSAANQLAGVVPQLIFALATVVAPKLSSFDSRLKAALYLKKLQFLVMGIALVGLLAIPLSFWIIPQVYGWSYQASIYPFAILLIAQLVFLLALPAHQAIFYYFAKPRLFVWIALGQLLISILLGWILISNFGAIGAALTVLAANLWSLSFAYLWVLKEFRKK